MDELLFMCLLICVILYVFVGDDGRLQYLLSLPMSECINSIELWREGQIILLI